MIRNPIAVHYSEGTKRRLTDVVKSKQYSNTDYARLICDVIDSRMGEVQSDIVRCTFEEVFGHLNRRLQQFEQPDTSEVTPVIALMQNINLFGQATLKSKLSTHVPAQCCVVDLAACTICDLQSVVRHIVERLFEFIRQSDSVGKRGKSRKKDPLSDRTLETFSDLFDSIPKPEVTKSCKAVLLCIEQCDLFSASVLQDLLSICDCYRATIPFIFLFTISTSVNSLEEKLLTSHQTSVEIDKVFAPLPSVFLNRTIETLFLNDFQAFRLGPEALVFLTDHFLYYDLSIVQFKRILKLCVLLHCKSEPLSFLCCQDDVEKSGKSSSKRSKYQHLIAENDSYHKNLHVSILLLQSLAQQIPKRLFGRNVREIYQNVFHEFADGRFNFTEGDGFNQLMAYVKLMEKDSLLQSINDLLRVLDSEIILSMGKNEGTIAFVDRTTNVLYLLSEELQFEGAEHDPIEPVLGNSPRKSPRKLDPVKQTQEKETLTTLRSRLKAESALKQGNCGVENVRLKFVQILKETFSMSLVAPSKKLSKESYHAFYFNDVTSLDSLIHMKSMQSLEKCMNGDWLTGTVEQSVYLAWLEQPSKIDLSGLYLSAKEIWSMTNLKEDVNSNKKSFDSLFTMSLGELEMQGLVRIPPRTKRHVFKTSASFAIS